jgi:uncharacterized membrane protein YcaP (DUF421 family)
MKAMSTEMLFQGWGTLARTVLIGVVAYAGLVIFVRVSGKRTLSKMNAFDVIVTVALASTLATVLLSPDVALAEGLLALGLLILLQYLVAWSAVRARWFRRLVKSEPTLVFHDGEFLDSALRRERVTPDEVLAAMRSGGVMEPAEVGAVVLETDGSLSVLPRAGAQVGTSTLASVQRIR